MCGFAGLLNNSFVICRQQISGIANQVAFRGPDNNGIRIYDQEMNTVDTGNNMLFFNRLAILDLDERSNQPFEDNRFVLTFNGEIYNYVELKGALMKEGYVFHTTSDTEVLFFALRHWGVNALSQLNGMFAFCWMDKREKTFLLARDRMGIKPLYYSQKAKTLSFGSELNSVLRLTGPLPEIKPEAVNMFLWTQFIPTPHTIVKGIYKLPPGHFIKGSFNDLANEQQLQPHAFWDAYSMTNTKAEESNPVLLESVLVDSLSRQLIADVPLGLFLSSGVDSSLLAALINKHYPNSQQFDFFTVAFREETISDESKDALSYINGFSNPALKCHILNIDAGFIGSHLKNLYDFFDEPFGDYTSLLNWVISKKAREHVTVALSGDGADELFWGYSRYEKWKRPSLHLTDKYHKIDVPKEIAGAIRPIIPSKYWQSKIALELEHDPLHRHFTLFLSPMLYHLTEQPIWEQPVWATKEIEQIYDRQDKIVGLLDLKTYLSDAMLYKVDRASMAASLEVRVPYLDNKVVDYALSLPQHSKSNAKFKYKAILKELLQRLAPHYDINRPKKGFNFPLDKWLRLEWKDLALSIINQESLSALSLDDKLYMNMVQKYYAGNKKYSIVVWYLLNLVLWQQKFKKIIPIQQV
ncbi:MAG TPA: asparagine synthase (glutamine-hydrolyzing) [Chitinophagaceae bacterium]|nr:asparagine synthase (glutamine-hydrolyzing) [Chitinophagaceae bacterium]